MNQSWPGIAATLAAHSGLTDEDQQAAAKNWADTEAQRIGASWAAAHPDGLLYPGAPQAGDVT
jgi:hypothetical protein